MTELAALLQEVPRSAFDSYNAENQRRGTLPALETVVLLSEKEVSCCLGKKASAAGWKTIQDRFGLSRIYSFSRVGLSPGGRFAVVSLVMEGQTPGEKPRTYNREKATSVYFLEREGDDWHKLYELTVP